MIFNKYIHKIDYIKLFPKIILTTILIIMCFSITSYIFANSDVNITIDKEVIKKDETFNLNIDFNNYNIASFSLNIFFDTQKLEYLKNVENSNFVDNKIIYTWTATNFNDIENQLNNIPNFSFKALSDGNAIIVITGEYYDTNGNKLDIQDESHSIVIGETNLVTENDNIANQNNTQSLDPNNSKLEILRFNEEGLNPNFSSDVYEYYFLIDESINSFDITAIPQNINSSVDIKGNSNFKNGLNVIDISVLSEDKSSTSNYVINVTKTNNPDLANTNLETLAIKQGSIYPELDNNITNYTVNVGNDISTIDVLAIPEKPNSNISISKPDVLEEGNNIVEILVTAENGETTKLYTINVYRRNMEEETAILEKRNYDTQLVATLINENDEPTNPMIEPRTSSPSFDNNTNSTTSSTTYDNSNISNVVVIVLIISILIFICTMIYIRYTKRKNSSE